MPTRALLKRLQINAALDADDVETIKALPMAVRDFPAHAPLAREGARSTQCCVLIEGFACRSKTTFTGKRQILSIHIAGEIVDLHGLHLQVMDHDVTTLSKVKAGFIGHDSLLAITRERPMVAEALWRYSLRDAAMFREWIVNIGRRPAINRLAHLLVEIATRIEEMGFAGGARFELPMTQLDIADALGLTPVHVNRVIQELRRDGLLELHKHTVLLPDLPRLKQLATFDDLYLHRSEALSDV